MREIAAAMLAGVLTATTTVRADSDFASEMLPICKAVFTDEARRAGEAAIKSTACLGQVFGIASTLIYLEFVCTPQGIKSNEALRVVLKYLDDHPERLHESFTVLAIEGLISEWPCSVPRTR